MTLVELLITIAIIATLSAIFLGVSRSATELTRRSRTKSTIVKIHTLLTEHWATYATRRVEVKPSITNAIKNSEKSSVDRGQMLADMRLLALRELMAIEMPDSWSDILQAPVGADRRTEPYVLNAFPTLRGSYLRRYDLIKDPQNDNDREDIVLNEGAECLYMLVMLATGDGEARTLFNEQDIGDTDGDGAPEFLDGWGRPIHYIRWPAGFVARSDLMSGDADADHDPFDPFRRDLFQAPRPLTNVYQQVLDDNGLPYEAIVNFIDELRDDNPAYRILPLIYSAGPDGETDIDDLPYTGNAPPTGLDPCAFEKPPSAPEYEVFVPFVDNIVFGFPFDKNEDGDDNSIDNIHNHLQVGK